MNDEPLFWYNEKRLEVVHKPFIYTIFSMFARCVRDKMRLYWNTLFHWYAKPNRQCVCACSFSRYPALCGMRMYRGELYICTHLMNKKTKYTNFILSEIDPDANREEVPQHKQFIPVLFFSTFSEFLFVPTREHFYFREWNFMQKQKKIHNDSEFKTFHDENVISLCICYLMLRVTCTT